jgi:hypothetical protein
MSTVAATSEEELEKIYKVNYLAERYNAFFYGDVAECIRLGFNNPYLYEDADLPCDLGRLVIKRAQEIRENIVKVQSVVVTS